MRIIKKGLSIILTALMVQSIAITSVSAVNTDVLEVSAGTSYSEISANAVKVSLDKTNIYLYENETEQLTATVVPEDATSTLKWSSNNTNVAIVDNNGKITAINKGIATITVKTSNGLTDSCKVNVSAIPQEVFLDKTSLTMVVQDTYTLIPSVAPEDAYSTYEWWTSDASTVSVDDNGNLTAKRVGTATIAVTTSNGISTLCTVNVIAVPTSIRLNKTELTLRPDEVFKLTKIVSPSNAVSDYVWKSSDPKVAIVDEDGNITAKSLGKTVISVTSDNGIVAECQVEVKRYPTSISIDKNKLFLGINSSEVITPQLEPDDSYAVYTWKSSDARVAVVDINGKVIGRGIGNCIVTVTTDNGKTASCEVTVSAEPTSIRINEVSQNEVLSIQKGKTKQFTTTILPANVQTTCTWESSDPDIVSVDNNGLITAVSVGTAQIKVKTSNGIEDSRTVFCGEIPTAISLDFREKTLDVNDTLQITPNVEPILSVTDLTWTYENNGVISASVNAKTGVLNITARNAGKTTLTVTTDNGLSASCTIEVIARVKTVEITNASPIKINLGETVRLSKRVTPSNAISTFEWTSSNERVATVDANGLVTSIGIGKTEIVVTSDNGISGSCIVEVCPEPDSVTLNENKLSLKNNETVDLVTNLSPENAYTSYYSWSSSNTSVATVSYNGKVTGRDTGTAIITVTTKNGKTATCEVNVIASPVSVAFVENSTYWLREGEKGKLTTVLYPTKAITDFKWTSSDTEIATVDQNGTITAIKQGQVIITVETDNGKKASLRINIYIKPTKVSFAQLSLSMYVTQKFTFVPILKPENSITSGYTWESSNTDVATVDQKGNVIAKKIGTAVISATNDLNQTAKCIVTVYPVPEDISLNTSSVNLNVGKTYSLSTSVSPDNALTAYTWTSSNTDVATVDENGKVKAVSVGTATITVSTSNDKIATCKINVKKTPTNIELNKTSLELGEGQTYTFTTNLTPSNSYSTYSWSSDNISVATVNSNGKVAAKSAGTAVITVKTSNGKTATCNLTVKKGPNSISVNETSVQLGAGQTCSLTSKLTPSNAVTYCSWSSNKTSVAKVDSDGKVTAKSAGTATITVKTSNGKTATCKVTVKAEPTNISISKKTMDIGLGQSYTLDAQLTPNNAFISNVWSSSNSNIVSVNSLGKITARGVGTATITVKTYNGITDKCVVTVKTAPESISINKTAINLGVGQETTLTSTLTPSNAYTYCNWSSSDTSVATVNSNGVVTGKKVGTVTITVKTSNGKLATCKVNVKKAPTSVKLTQTAVSLSVGNSCILNKTVTPANCATTFKWKSSNTSVATVDSTGKVVAKSKGTATITVTTFNGKTSTCKVTVK